MRQRSNTPLLLVLVLLLGGAGAFAWFALSDREPTETIAAGPGVADPGTAAEPLEAPDAGLRAVEGRAEATPGATTGAWPVQLWLEQVEAAGLPEAEGVPPLGTGRGAQLEGRVVRSGDVGASGQLEFVAGPNRGRILPLNERGEFGATDLYPGLSVVRVSGRGIPGSLREVRLRRSKGEVLNIDYGIPGTMIGTVFDAAGEPLEGVSVTCDGLRTTTNEDGLFYYPEVAGGTNLILTLEKEGFARLFQVVGVGALRPMSKDRYKFRMRPEAILEVAVSSAVGGPGPTQLILLPANTLLARDFPWWEVSPIEVTPGQGVEIRGLPPVKVALRTFHPGAIAKPSDRRINLRAGTRTVERIQLEPGPLLRGVVRDEQGRVVPGARVRLEAPDRVAAMMLHLKEMPNFLETEVVPTFPVSEQETVTDAYGRYVLSDWTSMSRGLYLSAESADGELWAGRIVREGGEGDREFDLVLEQREEPVGELEIEFPGRVQGTPVEVAVNGEPIDPGVVPLGEALRLEELGQGTWHLRGVWNGIDLFEGRGYREVRLEDRGRVVVQLPEGAIHGQDEETLRRAGERP